MLTGGRFCAWLTNRTYTITVGTTNWTAVVAGGKVDAVAVATGAPKISAVSVTRSSTLNGTFTAATPASTAVSGGKRTLTCAIGGAPSGFFKVE